VKNAQAIVVLRRAAQVAFGVLVLFLFGTLAWGFAAMFTGHVEPRGRPFPGLALFSFSILSVILAAFGVDVLLTGLQLPRLRRFAKIGDHWVGNVVLWVVLILLFFGFYSVLAEYGSAR
jgi:hypothetical protein